MADDNQNQGDQGSQPQQGQQPSSSQPGQQPKQQNPPQPTPQNPLQGGAPMSGQSGSQMDGVTPPPPKPEDTTPADYKIGQHLPPVIDVKIPAHNLQFDEQKFLHLLAGSISLTKLEKKRIIESIPKLRQEQVDELIRIFEEERQKFAELSQKHVEQLKKLEKQHWADWQDIELEQKAGQKAKEDESQADEIRKKLGL